MRRRMTWTEFLRWGLYFRDNPSPSVRAEILAARICEVIWARHRQKGEPRRTIKSFLLWGRQMLRSGRLSDPRAIAAYFKGWATTFGKVKKAGD